MAKKRKRDRTDSASEQHRIMAAAFNEIKPPAHLKLQQSAIPFFHSIIAEQANAEWTEHTIALAALLAIQIADLFEQESEIQREGPILKTIKGYLYANPRKSVIQLRVSNILALRRSLSIHARAQGVNLTDMARRNCNAKAIQNVMLTLDEEDDELIARPNRN